MISLDSFHDPEIAGMLVKRLQDLDITRPMTLMHVCGTHEHSLAKAGIRSILPGGIRLVAGPGCHAQEGETSFVSGFASQSER